MRTYLVGGAVRDKLMGLVPKERDWVVVGADRADMLAQGFKEVGKEFPVFIHPETGEEYALARTERKTAPGYHGFEFNTAVSLEEDLRRRDLTINALAEDNNGNIIDPYGGQKDLNAKILRAVSPAFAEDPVRVLRLARFAARFPGFKVADDTMTLVGQIISSGELQFLTAERVWLETHKALATDRPDRYFEVLRATGALKKIFPEIDRLFGVPQPEKHHPEKDVGIHTMMVLRQACRLSSKTTVRFAALTHDLGKGTTAKEILPHHYGHEKRSANLVKALGARLKIPKNHIDFALLVAVHHGKFHQVLNEMKPETVTRFLYELDAWRRPWRFADFLSCCLADQRGRSGFENHASPQYAFLRTAHAKTAELDINKIIQSLPPLNNGAQIKEKIFRARLEIIKEIGKDYAL